MVNTEDFTYSKGYLGLLSTLGASLGMILLCAPAAMVVYRQLREEFLKRAPSAVQVDEENVAAASETVEEVSLPTLEGRDNPYLAHVKSARRSMYHYSAGVSSNPRPYGGIRRHQTF